MHLDAPATVTRRLDARLVLSDDCAIDFATLLHYDARAPYAVTATFLLAEDREVEWAFGRDLLHEGLHRPAGEGDVALRPTTGAGSTEVELVLSAPGRRARVVLPVETVAAFLRASHQVVPPGAESGYLDLDATIEQLLGEE